MNNKPSLLNSFIRFCLEQKLVVVLFTALMIAWGILVAPFDWELGGLPRDPVPVDAIPNYGENQQIVFTEWPGRSPQDIDDQITYPLTVSLLGVPGVKSIRSLSMFGFSSIYVIFKDDVDFYWSRTRLLEKLNSLPPNTLPQGVSPTLGPDATPLGQVFWYTLEGRDPQGNPTGGWDLHELRSIQDWIVRYKLMSADGVAEVASVGGYVQEYQIDIDPDAMRAYDVTLDQVFTAVRQSNLDVGARTIEINKAEYIVRGRGFIENLEDIENIAVAANRDSPVYIHNIAHVTRGPALRRGALDKAGAEAVGGVVTVRYDDNPMRVIENIKQKIEDIEPGLPSKVLADGTESKITIVPFYDRTELINETLGTLNAALTQQVLVTIIVVILMVIHLRSSLLISAMLPLAVLMTFITMKYFGVDANIVALSGIAIAVGTIVDMGIVLCENILRHLDRASPDDNRLEVIYRASTEVGSAILTAVLTTVVSFLPVFTMEAAEGKLFKPLAYTKTFALIASIIIALVILPAMAHLLFGWKMKPGMPRRVVSALVGLSGAAILAAGYVWAGLVIFAFALFWLIGPMLPNLLRKALQWGVNLLAVAVVLTFLVRAWEPLGVEAGFTRNTIFVGGIIVGLLLGFYAFMFMYPTLLRWCLRSKLFVTSLCVVFILAGLAAWLGPAYVFGPHHQIPDASQFGGSEKVRELLEADVLARRADDIVWSRATLSSTRKDVRNMLSGFGVEPNETLMSRWALASELDELRGESWDELVKASTDEPVGRRLMWMLANSWDGFGKEFMPSLDEGSFLYMPTTMPHASIGEALDVIQKLDMAQAAIPEVDQVVGKIGRADTPLDPAPVSMVETIINYKSEYKTDKQGHRIKFKYDQQAGEFVRDENGQLIEDPNGRPFRQWRDHIQSPSDIWDELAEAGELPGTTSAPPLQPIETRIIMLQSGFRAPMGIKVFGPDLDTIESVGLKLEELLKKVPGVRPATVFADRVVGKPYLEIDIDRERIARYGITIGKVQDVIEVAVGGRPLTMTVEGRERYPVRVRYQRERRDTIEELGNILVPTPDGRQIPIKQLADIEYVRGPQVIKSENTFLVAYVIFDKQPGYAEVDVVNNARNYIEAQIESGDLEIPAGVSYEFGGSFKNQVRAAKRLRIVLPLALAIIFLILYFQFRSAVTTFIVFSGVFLAWSGGFLLMWLYGQPWFMDFSVFGTNMRDLFQISEVNLSVAVWVGFLALFGIATDNGVILATLLKQVFENRQPGTIDETRAAAVEAGQLRVRACLMTTATTTLALLPVLTSTGRGADVMVPMAIPSFGGMIGALLTLFLVPVLYCWVYEARFYPSMIRKVFKPKGGNR